MSKFTHKCDQKYWDANTKQCLLCGMTAINIDHMENGEPPDMRFIAFDNSRNPRSIDNFSERRKRLEELI